MSIKQTKVLLIEDDPSYAELIREILLDEKNASLGLEYADRLSKGITCTNKGDIDVVLLDLSLPDSKGIDTFLNAQTEMPGVPIIILTGLDDEAIGVQTVQNGAQDYLVKGKMDGQLLVRSIRYAIERHQMKMDLLTLSLTDRLTGIYNRNGFLTLAKQHLEIANRMNKGLLLLYSDLDNLKIINDTFGHYEGDRALIDIADILKKSFIRGSDIIARMGGDEFAVIAFEEIDLNPEILSTRMQHYIYDHNERANRKYKLSLSMGIVHYDYKLSGNLDDLLIQADKLMYEQKRNNKQSGL